MLEFDLDQWGETLVASSLVIGQPSNRSAVIAVETGKKTSVVLAIESGRAVGLSEDEAEVTVPSTVEQLRAYGNRTRSIAEDYMRGDIKPVGSIGAFLALVELFENDELKLDI